MSKTAVIAFGGNALLRSGQEGFYQEQLAKGALQQANGSAAYAAYQAAFAAQQEANKAEAKAQEAKRQAALAMLK